MWMCFGDSISIDVVNKVCALRYATDITYNEPLCKLCYALKRTENFQLNVTWWIGED